MSDCNSNTLETMAGGSRVHSHPWLHSELEASFSYTKLCLMEKKMEGESEEIGITHMY